MSDIKKKDELLDDGLEDLIQKRKSVPLTPDNAHFYRSEGGLVSLTLTHEDGEKEIFERVAIFRAFPITVPDEFLSVREISVFKNEKGNEIGMIRYLSDLDEDSQKVILEELDRRYFIPEIHRIHHVREKLGYQYWDCDTSAGHIVFALNNPFGNISVRGDGHVFFCDMDGNYYTVTDPKALDSASYKHLEIYI